MKRLFCALTAALVAAAGASCGKKNSSSDSEDKARASADLAAYTEELKKAAELSNAGGGIELLNALYPDKFVEVYYADKDIAEETNNKYELSVAEVAEIRKLSDDDCKAIGKAYGELASECVFERNNPEENFSDYEEYQAALQSYSQGSPAMFTPDRAYQISVRYDYKIKPGRAEGDEVDTDGYETLYAYYINGEGWAFDTWVYAKYAVNNSLATALYRVSSEAVGRTGYSQNPATEGFIIGSSDEYNYNVPEQFDVSAFRDCVAELCPDSKSRDYFFAVTDVGMPLYIVCGKKDSSEPECTWCFGGFGMSNLSIMNFNDYAEYPDFVPSRDELSKKYFFDKAVAAVDAGNAYAKAHPASSSGQ